MDADLIVMMVWGGATLWVWGLVFRDRQHDWRQYRDHRAWRAMLSGLALFITAGASAFAILAVAVVGRGQTIPAIASAIALGAFTAAGWYSRDENRRRDNGEAPSVTHVDETRG